MNYDLGQLKALVESGDTATLQTYLYKALEKEDVALVQKINAQVRSVLDSEKDTHHAKALETWKSNHLETLVDEEVKKRHPEQTPEQMELAKLRKEIEDEKNARHREVLKNAALAFASKKKLPTDLLDFFIGADEEQTQANLTKFEEILTQVKQAVTDELYKENGSNPDRTVTQTKAMTSLAELANASNLRNQ